MKPAQLVLEGSIALPVLLRLLPRVPRGVRVGGLLREQQEQNVDELYDTTPCHSCCAGLFHRHHGGCRCALW